MTLDEYMTNDDSQELGGHADRAITLRTAKLEAALRKIATGSRHIRDGVGIDGPTWEAITAQEALDQRTTP